MTSGQRAIAVSQVHEWAPAHREKKEALIAPLSKTAAELASIADVSPRTIKLAKAVIKGGFADRVKSSELSVNEAERIVSGKSKKVSPKTVKPEQVVSQNDNRLDPPGQVRTQAWQPALETEKHSTPELMSGDELAQLHQENEQLRRDLQAAIDERDVLSQHNVDLLKRLNALEAEAG